MFLVSIFTSNHKVRFLIMLPTKFGCLLLLLVDSCWSYGVKGGSQQGVKSYGGYVHDSGLPSNFVHSAEYHQQQQQPNYYQPYGWNYNQPRRTYGGVMQPSYQNNPQGFGWFGGGNQFGNTNDNQYPNNDNNGQASFQKTPSLFLPNFVPPVYFPNAPYPTFPNYNFNQFPFAPNYNPNAGHNNNQAAGDNQFGGGQAHHHRPQSGEQDNGQNQFNGQRPPQQGPGVYNQVQPGNQLNHFGVQPPQHVAPLNPPQAPSHHHVNAADDKFLTNAFFGSSQQGSDRQWSEDDEMKWQATTKAPYFENKIPGLPTCTLPASAVLGATTALKASSLLPLNVPIGKPILSCNATELLQAQINLNGITYDCLRSAITMSCPRVDANGLIQDECHGETLECDVRMRQNSRSVSCTNGTLISNHPIVCKSATLMEKKNVLNCHFKGSGTDAEPAPIEPTPSPSRLPELTTVRPRPTARPVIVPNVSVLPPLEPEKVDEIDDVHIRFNSDRKKLEVLNLQQEVQKAMDSIFPHELLSVASRKMYLPPKFSDGSQLPSDLKEHLNGVFPHDLLAISQTDEAKTEEFDGTRGQGLSLPLNVNQNREAAQTSLNQQRENQNQNRDDQASFTQQRQSQWDVNVNRKTGNPGSSIKTQSRFGGVTEAYDDDRLIFTS